MTGQVKIKIASELNQKVKKAPSTHAIVLLVFHGNVSTNYYVSTLYSTNKWDPWNYYVEFIQT